MAERRTLTCALAAMLMAILTTGGALAAERRVETSDRGARVTMDGQLFIEYLVNEGSKPFLWPVMGPGQVELTRAYPMRKVPGEKEDHIHQRSFWFTHGSVNGVDFWSENDPHGSIVQRQMHATVESGVAIIRSSNDWLGPDGGKILEDSRNLKFRGSPERRMIDFEIELKATAGDVTFGDTKEGTFGIRVPTVMDVDSAMDGHIVNSNGEKDEPAWGKRASWVDYSGPINGDVLGIAVLNHPSSFRYPTYWHVRTYGLFAANPFGVHEFTNGAEGPGDHLLASGESIQLRYRVILHRGRAEEADIAGAFGAYAAEEFSAKR